MRKAFLLLLLLLMPLTALAEEVPEAVAADLQATYASEGEVTVLLWEPFTGELKARPRFLWTYSDVSFTVSAPFVPMYEHQVASLAKGESDAGVKRFKGTAVTLVTLDPGVDPEAYRHANRLGIGGELKLQTPKGYLYTGPAEDSRYNTRAYYVRVYGERGRFSARATSWFYGADMPMTGLIERPIGWVLYAVDSFVLPDLIGGEE